MCWSGAIRHSSREKEIVYFQDVYDHLLRVTDTVDIYRDMLSSVLDANLSMVSYTLNVAW